jgi:glucokinase
VGALTPAIVADAARRGDPGARRVWEEAGRYLGLGLVGLVNLLNPDVIAIGGGISGAGRFLLGPARRVVRERALPIPARHVRIVRSSFGPDAGALGAAGEAFAAAGATPVSHARPGGLSGARQHPRMLLFPRQ